MSEIETLIRKCLISLIINKGESYQRTDLLEEIEFMLEQILVLLPKELPCSE